MKQSILNYRPEIDGLRCLAVLSVIFYHGEITIFGESFFKGGFLGVDIFFVISGYLITSIIINDTKNNNFSIFNFYKRRFRRIFPALISILLVNILIGYFILLPDQFIELAKSFISSIFFISNYFFYYIGQEYSATNSFLIPFIHTWSLGVEEQFYIIYPIIFVIFYRLIDFKKIIIILFLVSLLFSHLFFQENPSLNFYIIISRIWELMLGAILSVYNLSFFKRNNFLINLFFIVGFFLLLFSLLFGSHRIPHPTFFTLVPAIGTFLVIATSEKVGTIGNSLLSSKIFIFIGKISFSLYLWHYPIFAYAKIIEVFNVSIFGNFLIYSLVFLLSIFTYKYIEQPFRKEKIFNIKKTFTIFSSLSIMMILFSFYILNKNGLPDRFPKVIVDHFQNPHPYHLVTVNNRYCHNFSCVFNNNYDKEIFLLGDSNIATLQKPILNYSIKKDYKFTTLTHDGCSYVKDFEKISKITNQISGCLTKDYLIKRNLMLSNKNSIVVLGQRMPLYLSGIYFNNQEGGVEDGEWPNYLVEIKNGKRTGLTNKKKFKKNFVSSINEILNNGNKVVLVYPIPEVGWNPIRVLLNKGLFNKNVINQMLEENYISTSYDVFVERTKETYQLYDSIKHENLIRVYPEKLFCNTIKKDRCIVNKSKKIFYYDDDHLSLEGSRKLFELIINKIEK